MRYLTLILFAGFILFCVDFATQNTEIITIRYSFDLLKFNVQAERPIFVPIFFTLAFGIIFCVIYFFVHHSWLLSTTRNQRNEIKRLKRLVLSEREKQTTMEERNNELQRIVERVQNRIVNKSPNEETFPEEQNSQNGTSESQPKVEEIEK